MALVRIGWGDWVSLSRIVLSLIFLIAFRPAPGIMLTIATMAAIAAQITDHLDGYLAKRLNQKSVLGWIFDSYADRAFYIAAILAFEREYGLNELIVWTFVLRELAFYALRILTGDFLLVLRNARPLALIHAGIVRVVIALGCIVPYSFVPQSSRDFMLEIIPALLVFAILFGFVSLYLVFKRSASP